MFETNTKREYSKSQRAKHKQNIYIVISTNILIVAYAGNIYYNLWYAEDLIRKMLWSYLRNK